MRTLVLSDVLLDFRDENVWKGLSFYPGTGTYMLTSIFGRLLYVLISSFTYVVLGV